MAIELFDIPAFHYAKESGILDVQTTPQEVVTLTTAALDAGVYLIGYALAANFNGQKNQPLTITMTGTFGGQNVDLSAGDNDGNDAVDTYFFPKEHAGGPITIGINCSKSAAFAAQCDVDFVDVIVSRVG